MSALFRRLFRTAIFSRFSKGTIATSNFMKEFYNGEFAHEFSISMLKITIALVRDYGSETRKQEAKLAEKYLWKPNMKSISNETINTFLQKVLFLLHFGSCQNLMSSANLVETLRNFVIKEFWALENHVLVNMLLVNNGGFASDFSRQNNL